ncbi:hypothetical protein [Leifsonia sp. TF02-11]|uniref:hypothetical protein n=1 Tax=Leifsonia sp. TF02-11 TaxID=2815212 RepID=UPI001AA1522A|nr:hypothetical protein [Leifsonia sp. TF02-11]MBN9633343.1 hypothetical protein [Actinomycetota bacterium]MBO1739539.1 hypothetical protein [Leifsonia sp. TF02-11]
MSSDSELDSTLVIDRDVAVRSTEGRTVRGDSCIRALHSEASTADPRRLGLG